MEFACMSCVLLVPFVLWYGALKSTMHFFPMSSFAVMCAMSLDAILSQVCFTNGHIVVVVSIDTCHICTGYLCVFLASSEHSATPIFQ